MLMIFLVFVPFYICTVGRGSVSMTDISAALNADFPGCSGNIKHVSNILDRI